MADGTERAKAVMDRAARKALLEALRQALPDVHEEAALLAQIRKIHFEASIKEGFTTEQALVLCMKPQFGG